MMRWKKAFSSAVGMRFLRSWMISSARVRIWEVFLLFLAERNKTLAQGTKANLRRSLLMRASRISSPFSRRSILLMARMRPLFSSRAYWAMWQSWAVTPMLPSMRRTTTSLRSMPRMQRRAENFSMPRSILPRRRRPAVSMRLYFLSLKVTSVSVLSRVVPAMSETMIFSSPKREFTSEDLPALGLPRMHIWARS